MGRKEWPLLRVLAMTRCSYNKTRAIAELHETGSFSSSISCMVFTLAMVLLFLATHNAGTLFAGNIRATTCNSYDLQAAIDAATDGDTVTVPPCDSGLWFGNVTMPNTKGLLLKGAEAGTTRITMNGNQLILDTSSSRKPIRITGFTFISTNTTESILVTGTAQDWRIDHNIFDGNFVNGGYTVRVGSNNCNVDSFTYGVIDHNQFINRNYTTSIFIQWQRGNIDTVVCGDWIWSQMPQRGTTQAVYIEDNVFSGSGAASQVVDARWGAKYVLRYNTIHNPWISTHSGCTNGGSSPLWVEIYNNRFTDDGHHYPGSQVEMRSVSGVVFGNISTARLNRYVISVDHERSYRTDCAGKYGGMADGSRAFDGNIVGQFGWRALGQPGWGPPQVSNTGLSLFSGFFAWGNMDANTPRNLVIANNNGNTSKHLQFGRELFTASEMAIGLIASRSSNCSFGPPRSVYVSTDENVVGAKIYVCTPTNTWVKHWEPYIYPHPYTSSSPPIDRISPPPPLGLKVN